MVSDMELGVELVKKDGELENMEAAQMPVEPDTDGMADMGGGMSGGSGQSGGGSGGGMGGMLEMLGGIGTKMGALLGIAGVLLMLEPIQQVLSMIMRFLEVMILPFVAILMTLLQPLLQKLLKAMPQIMSVAEKIGNFYKEMYATLFDIAKKMASALIDALPSWLTGGDGGSKDPRTQKQKVASAGALGLASLNPATMGLAPQASQAAGNADWDEILRKMEEMNMQVIPESVYSDKTDESKKESMAGTTTEESEKTYGGS